MNARLQALARVVRIEACGGQRRQRRVPVFQRGLQIGARQQPIGHQQLAGRQARQRRGKLRGQHRLGREVGGRQIEPGQRQLALRLGERGEIIVAARIEQRILGERAGRDHPHDRALDHRLGAALLGLGGILDLLADRDLEALADQAREIGLVAVHRHAAHRDVLAQVLAALGQRDVERGRRAHRIVEEQLVEIAHPVEQQMVRMRRLDRQVLAHHRGRICRNHRGPRGCCRAPNGFSMAGLPAFGGQLGETRRPGATMQPPTLARLLVPRLPFFYGWIVLGCVCLAGFARQGPAVSVLSIFIVPMTTEFGWSRTEIAGAVSLGGVLAAVVSPLIGPVLDRRGARLVLCLAVLGTGLATMALSLTQSLAVFYLLFCFARMNWAGPFELGLYGALNNWFVARRAFAASVASLAQMSGLVALPLIAQFAMQGAMGRPAAGGPAGWRSASPCWSWASCRSGCCWCGGRRISGCSPIMPPVAPAPRKPAAAEPRFTRATAMRTWAFWLLAALQHAGLCGAGGRHPAPGAASHRARPLADRRGQRRRGLLGAFSAVASFGVGFLPRRWPVRYSMAAAALCPLCRRLRPDRRQLGRRRLRRRRTVRPGHRRDHDPDPGRLGATISDARATARSAASRCRCR